MRDGASTRRKTNKRSAFEYNKAALSISPMSSSTCKTHMQEAFQLISFLLQPFITFIQEIFYDIHQLYNNFILYYIRSSLDPFFMPTNLDE